MLIVIFEIAKHLMEKVFSMLEPMTPTRVAQTVSELPASKLHPVQNHCVYNFITFLIWGTAKADSNFRNCKTSHGESIFNARANETNQRPVAQTICELLASKVNTPFKNHWVYNYMTFLIIWGTTKADIVIFEIKNHLIEKVFSMPEPMTPTRGL